MAPKELLRQLILWIVTLCPKILHLLSQFYPIFSCVDPDPKVSWIRIQYQSASTTLPIPPPPPTIMFRPVNTGNLKVSHRQFFIFPADMVGLPRDFHFSPQPSSSLWLEGSIEKGRLKTYFWSTIGKINVWQD